MRIYTFLALLLCFTAPLFAQTNYYTVKFPDDRTYIGCNANVPVEEPVITQYGCNINVGVSRYDQVFNSNESGSCFKILRRWRLLYWCDYDANIAPVYINNPTNTDTGPTVVGNSDNHGYLEYIQIIKVRDDEPPVFTNCPTEKVIFCDYTNNNSALYSMPPHFDYCEGPVDLETNVSDVCSGLDLTLSYRLYLDMDSNGSMETFVSSSDPNAWPITLTTPGNLLHGKIEFPAGFQLPYGIHKIEWIAGDHCGNEATCKYEFEVRDCLNPTIVCINGLSANLMQSGMVTVWASDFVQYTLDNCTPSDQIKIAIRKAGTGTGFPAGSTGLTFDCTEVGTQLVEVWAEDAHGNADYCETYILIQDNMGVCVPTSSISNKVVGLNGGAMPNVEVSVKNNQNNTIGYLNTAENGNTDALPLYPGCYQLVPSYAVGQPIEDITVWDALLAAMHTYGVSSLDQPWQYPAADVDGDGWISPADAEAIVKLAIGAQYSWPAAPKWQFLPIDAAIPTEPFNTAALPFCLTAGEHDVVEWITFKTGDLNQQQSSNFSSLEERGATVSKRKVWFTTPDQAFAAGETVEVTINTPNITGIAGLQSGFSYQPEMLVLTAVNPGLVPANQIVRFDDFHLVTLGWQDITGFYPDAASLFSNQEAVHFTFTALQDGKLSDALSISNAPVKAEVYTRDYLTRQAGLWFTPAGGNKPQIVMVSPNPVTSDVVTIQYNLPKDTEAQIALLNAQGAIEQLITVDGSAGAHEVVIPVGARKSGIGLVQLMTNEGFDIRKVVSLK